MEDFYFEQKVRKSSNMQERYNQTEKLLKWNSFSHFTAFLARKCTYCAKHSRGVYALKDI